MKFKIGDQVRIIDKRILDYWNLTNEDIFTITNIDLRNEIIIKTDGYSLHFNESDLELVSIYHKLMNLHLLLSDITTATKLKLYTNNLDRTTWQTQKFEECIDIVHKVLKNFSELPL